MKDYTFIFYNNGKPLESKIICGKTMEDARNKANRILIINKKYDDWEYISPHDDWSDAPRRGTQRSPFGIGS